MTDTDALLTIAEIAVAFAGFAGIASALGRRYSHFDPKVNSLRLHNMVDVALTVIIVALIPVLLIEIIVSERYLWMACSLISLIFGVLLFFRTAERSKPIRELEGYNTQGHQKLRVLGILLLVGFAIGIVGPLPEFSYALYLGSVLLLLLISGDHFLRVIPSLVYRETNEAEEDANNHVSLTESQGKGEQS